MCLKLYTCLDLPCHPVLHQWFHSNQRVWWFPLPFVGLNLTPRVTICRVYILHYPQLLVLVHCFQPCLSWATARHTSLYMQFCDSVNPVTASIYISIPSESAILHEAFQSYLPNYKISKMTYKFCDEHSWKSKFWGFGVNLCYKWFNSSLYNKNEKF